MLVLGYIGGDYTKDSLGTAIAVLGAVGSIITVYSQIESGEIARRQELAQKAASLQASIALPLSSVANTQKLLIDEIGSWLRSVHNKNWVYAGALSTPKITSDVVSALAEAIEYFDSLASQDIAELVAEIQIQDSRLTTIRQPRQSSETAEGRLVADKESNLVSAILVYARTSRLFYYARKQEEKYASTSFRDIIEQTCFHMMEKYEMRDKTLADIESRRDTWLCRKFLN